jgi:hypothetical protein
MTKTTSDPNIDHQRFVPHGYQSLYEAIEDAGRSLYPEEWTGEERGNRAHKFRHLRSGPEKYLAQVFLDVFLDKVKNRRNEQSKNDERLKRQKKLTALKKAIKASSSIRSDDELPIILRKSQRSYHVDAEMNSNEMHDEVIVTQLITSGLDIISQCGFIEPDTEEWKATYNSEDPAILKLKEEVSILTKRRWSVEKACQDALCGIGENVSSCESYFINDKGQLCIFKASLWATNNGYNAIRTDAPGHFLVEGTYQSRPLLRRGELAAAVLNQDNKDKTSKESPHSSPAANISATTKAKKWFAEEVKKNGQTEVKNYYISSMTKEFCISNHQATKVWYECTRDNPSWGNPGRRKNQTH